MMLSSAQTPVSNEKPRQSAVHGCRSGYDPGSPWGQHSGRAPPASPQLIRRKPLPLPSGSIRWVEIAFYEPAGQDTYVATAATVGPWSLDAQHGGPPSALAARALERHGPDERQRPARVAGDIFRPVPVGHPPVRTRLVCPGRRSPLVHAALEGRWEAVPPPPGMSDGPPDGGY